MPKRLKVEIVTPERMVLSEEVDSLVVPAERGYLGVLAGHAPLLCTLRPGLITLRREGVESAYATSGGFMEVTPERTVLLTESAEEAGKIDVDRAKESLARAEERLRSTGADVDRERASASADRARNRLKTASKK